MSACFEEVRAERLAALAAAGAHCRGPIGLTEEDQRALEALRQAVATSTAIEPALCMAACASLNPDVLMTPSAKISTRKITPRTDASVKALGSDGKAASESCYVDTLLHKLLGQGAYGAVYHGICGQQNVAVKKMRVKPEATDDLKKEIKLLRNCECQNIVQFLDAFVHEHGSELWIVMELCEVGSARDLMKYQRAALEDAQVAYICQGVLHGLKYLHAMRLSIVHRDIKAANVLITSAGTIKIADLGVAQVLLKNSVDADVIGTPHWIAPEVYSLGLWGPPSDIWSLGITAIELAQTQPPWATIEPACVGSFIVDGPPPELDKEQAGFEFRRFLTATLVKYHEQRPTAIDLLEDPFIATAQQGPLLELVKRCTSITSTCEAVTASLADSYISDSLSDTWEITHKISSGTWEIAATKFHCSLSHAGLKGPFMSLTGELGVQ
mmetsp:Transcript_28862/g.47841  ORF Transcript_28862/g.47841 Transcript_28862/m.47841 type:complete len:441 (+) Transcript_28862:155-1477(+)|eukprot:CAMPEP_0119323350 /NCGR_PEP_ID=MMETSP1333-20130426/60503_1 /TAXON_ID=418940 /ORGANISM="Scyphosphaera apsteinii, Strain RCC1455" /LENGTH=440 /DNA_ID=CAMNT_0007330769 /DNA_START=155 /DNA_END=1477 /DNA_ORIENTATION=-